MEPGMLSEIQAIYSTHLRGEKIDVPAIEARLGRPLSVEQQDYVVEPGGVAVLRLSGVMAPKANLFSQVSGGISTQMAIKQLESAVADARVQSVLMAFDTPGGNVIGVPEFAAAIFELSAEKPIVVHTSERLMSAGYWSGSAANAIYISGPVVEVGSIGVVVDRSYNPSAVIQQEHITAGKYKRIGKANAPLSDDDRAIVQADVDYVYTLLVDDVARFRGTTPEQVLEHMADGRVFRGQQAIDAGLVDGVSTFDALLESMAADPAKYAKRRKAVFAVPAGDPKSKGAGAASKDNPQPVKKEIKTMDTPVPLTRASFEQDHAAIFAQVRAEFSQLGATQERERIQAVLAVGDGLPGHEELLTALAYDGKTTAAEASVKVLAAEKEARAAAVRAHSDDAPAAVQGAAAPTDKGGKTKEQQVDEAKAHAKENGITLTAALKDLAYAKKARRPHNPSTPGELHEFRKHFPAHAHRRRCGCAGRWPLRHPGRRLSHSRRQGIRRDPQQGRRCWRSDAC